MDEITDFSCLGKPVIKEFEDGPLEKVVQYPEPILKAFGSFKHIRNPGAIKEGDFFYLFPTVHCEDDKNRIYCAISRDGINFEMDDEPFIEPSKPGEKLYGDDLLGDEDLRLVRKPDGIEGYFTLVKEIENNHATMRLGWGKTDLITFEKKGIMFDPFKNNKDGGASNRKVNGRWYFYHRPFENIFEDRTLPAIVASSTGDYERKKWDAHEVIARPREDSWDSLRVGIAAPPIETKKGFFMTYHGADKDNVYRLGWLMLNSKNAGQVDYRCEKFIMEPIFDWHKKGQVDNVVFLNGWIPINERTIYAYPSGADSYIGFAKFFMRKGYEILEREFNPSSLF